MIHHGENLKRLLKERDITQKQFADKMGLSRIYFHSLLNKKKLSKLYLDKIKKHISTHTGRHSFAVRCAELGISIETRATLMGITIKSCAYYYKVTDRKIDKEFEVWNKL